MSNLSGATLSAKKTQRVEESIVLAEKRPAFTATWHPFSHGEVIDAVRGAVTAAGFKIERKEYSMKPQSDMFAVWEVNREDKLKELRFAVGIRNSIDKKMAVGLCAGERVFVCDNMVFSSEFVLFRKHTGRLDAEELTLMAHDAFAAVTQKWDSLYAWHEEMKSIEISTAQAAVLTMAAMRHRIIPAKHFVEWDRLFFGTADGSEKSKYSPTLHGWHGATTELMNDDAWNNNMWKQTRLNSFINHEAPILLAESATKKFFSLDAISERSEESEQKSREKQKVEARALRANLREKVDAARSEKRAAEKAGEREKRDAERAAKREQKKAEREEKKQKREAKKSEKKPAKSADEKAAKRIKKAEKEIGKFFGGVAEEAKKDFAAQAAGKQPKITETKISPVAEKKPRRTARVKIREKIAAAAEPIKTKAVKKSKGEKIKTIKKSAPKFDADDTLFCETCGGEFEPSKMKKIGAQYYCPVCSKK